MAQNNRKIVKMVGGILQNAGFDDAFSDADLKNLCRAIVGAYLARVGEALVRGEEVDLRQAELALKVMTATSGAQIEKAANDLSAVSTADLMRFVNVGNRG